MIFLFFLPINVNEIPSHVEEVKLSKSQQHFIFSIHVEKQDEILFSEIICLPNILYIL